MLLDDLLEFYTFEQVVLYDETMGIIECTHPVERVDQCFLFDVSFNSHILEDTLEIIMDYFIEIDFSIRKERDSLQRMSKKNHRSRIFSLKSKDYPGIMNWDDGTMFCHTVRDPAIHYEIMNGNKIVLKIKATVDGFVTRKAYSNIRMLSLPAQTLRNEQKNKDEVSNLSKKLDEVRHHLDVAHRELNDRNYVIDGLIQLLKQWGG